MVRCDNASIMSFEDLVAFDRWQKFNPTVDGLIFMDCAPNPKKKNQRGVFACYVTEVEKDPKTDEAVALHIGLVQWVKGIPQIFLVKISKEKIKKGDKVRFWDLAPSYRLLNEYPFPVSSDAEQKEEQKET